MLLPLWVARTRRNCRRIGLRGHWSSGLFPDRPQRNRAYCRSTSKPEPIYPHECRRYRRSDARLDTRPFDQDETRELAQWINNMIDSLESIMMQVKLTAGDVSASQQVMNDTTAVTVTSAQRVSGNISEMIHSMRDQLKDIDAVKESAEQMRGTLRQLERQANEQIDVAKHEVVRIGDKMSHISSKVEETNQTIRTFMGTVQEVTGVRTPSSKYPPKPIYWP